MAVSDGLNAVTSARGVPLPTGSRSIERPDIAQVGVAPAFFVPEGKRWMSSLNSEANSLTLASVPWSNRMSLKNSSISTAAEQTSWALVAFEKTSLIPAMWSLCQWVTTTRRTADDTSTPRFDRYLRATGGLPGAAKHESTTIQSPSPR